MALAALLLTAPPAWAQNACLGLIPDTPPSPQAAAFNRLGDYQVSNNYGSPDISIPLFEVDFHGYKIPLALHYEASPLRPGYNYDVTGMGWTLSGNSCVSRTIKDRADECADNPFTLDAFTYSSGDDKEYLYYHYNQLLDQVNFQYDSYSVVLPSGRTIPFFMYKSDGVMTYHMMPPDSHVRISCSLSPNSIDAFTVTDESGVTYHFTLPEKATNIFQDDPGADRYVTWLLTSIDIPARGTIHYQYTESPVVINTHNTLREPVVTLCRLYDSWGEWPQEPRFKVRGLFQTQSPRYEMRLLRRIIYGPSAVSFNYSDDGRHMREIVVSDNEETVRRFTLSVHGASQDPCWLLGSLVISGQDDDDRLAYGFTYSSVNPGDYTDYWGNICDAGPSVNGENGHSVNNYGLNDLGNFNMFFAYDGSGLTWEGIQSQLFHDGILARLIENGENDHHYYYKLKLQSSTEGDTRVPTAPDRHGVLTSITYPNGGRTSFSWENHRFPTATNADGDIVTDRRGQRVIEGGGFRIESVINWTADGETASEDYYRYGYTIGDVISRNFPLPLPDGLSLNDTVNHHTGCGEAVVDPNLLTFMSGFSYSMSLEPGATSTYSYADPAGFRNMLMGEGSRFRNISQNQNVQGIPVWWEVTFSAGKFRSLVGGRRPVVYPEVTIYHGQPFDTVACRSKTVYRYDIYKQQYPSYGQSGGYLSLSGQAAEPDTSYFEPLYFEDSYPALSCWEYPADRHQLRSRADYSYDAAGGSWQPIAEERYDYESHLVSESGFIFESFFSRESYYPNYGSLTYSQVGFTHPLRGVPLRAFYKPAIQRLGRSTLAGKSSTALRRGGTRSTLNTLDESYDYLYPGVMRLRKYSDQLKNAYSYTYDKMDQFSYTGEMDEGTDSVIAAMKARNMLASPVSEDTYLAPSTILSGARVEYACFGDDILPRKLYGRNGDVYEETAVVLSYDGHGNPTETVDLRAGDTASGTHTVFIWDTHGRYLTAVVRNATLSQVQGIPPQQLAGDSRSRHAALCALLPGAQVETWDYKPLVGVSSHTDAGGQTILYEYDGLGRLRYEKRAVGGVAEPEVLKQYEYDYLNPSL